ncbi:MAG: phosphoglycerate dehydrogenase [Candidatus Methanomethylicaceae archaeon]
MSKFKILITSRAFGKFSDAFKLLEGIAEVRKNKSEQPLKKDELIEKIKDCHALILGIEKITAEIMDHAKNLIIIARYGVGYDNVDIEAATKRGIIVTYTPHANSTSVAEHTFALILSLLKRIVEANLSIKSGEWIGTKFAGIELEGKTIGIIGTGAIGRKVAYIAKGFNMNILLYDIIKDENLEKSLNARYVDLKDLLMNSDIVSIHVPLTLKTHYMINEEELKLMKRNAIIVNTARGGIINEKALTKALKEKWIAGAALDVFEKEPPNKDNPLLKMNNVICTPHSAAFTIDALKRMDMMIVEDVISALRGEKPKYIVNREVLNSSLLRIK